MLICLNSFKLLQALKEVYTKEKPRSIFRWKTLWIVLVQELEEFSNLCSISFQCTHLSPLDLKLVSDENCEKPEPQILKFQPREFNKFRTEHISLTQVHSMYTQTTYIANNQIK